MESRIQFRVGEKTKKLAQQMAESQGQTLSDACRNLVETLAEQQRQSTSHNQWLAEQVNLAFEKLEGGESIFIEERQAQQLMEQRKQRIREKQKK